MRKIVKTLLLMSIFHILSFVVYGEIKLLGDKKSLSVNEGLRVRIEFLDEDKENYRIEGLENFHVMGKSSSRNISIVNLKKSVQESEDYLLKPIKPGKYTLKAVTSKNQSLPLEVDVIGNNSAGVQGTNQEISKINSSEPKEEFQILSTLKEEDNGRKYYFGEKIFIEEKFLLFRNPRSFSVISRPEYKDFLEKDFTPRDRNGNFLQNIERYKGRDTLKTLLYRGVIQGTSSGKKEIQGTGIEVVTGDYYYPGGLKKEIEILPLPEGKPENFKGIVGKLNLEHSFNKKSVQIGEPILLNIKLSGDVNLDNIEKIGITPDENFTVYETLKSSDEKVDEKGYYSEKNFEIAFVPKKGGELTLPEIKISYLDTENGEYKEKKVAREKINVAGGILPLKEKKSISNAENKNIEVSQPQGTEEKKVEKAPKLEFLDDESLLDSLFREKKIVALSLFINFLLIAFLIFMVMKKLMGKVGKKQINPWEIYLKKMEKRSDFHEFYENYCSYMQERYKFNPRTQSETKLKNEILKECNREMERALYFGEEIDRKDLLKKIRDAE